MLTKIVPIGNSRGIRIPKAMLETCGFGDAVELQAKNGALILRTERFAYTLQILSRLALTLSWDSFATRHREHRECSATKSGYESQSFTWVKSTHDFV